MSLFNNHARYEALVTEHLDGLLDATGEAKLREHLASCAECAAEVAEQKALLAVLRAEPLVEAPRSFALPYAPRTVEAPVSRVSKLLRSMQVATAAAALVLVFLVGINIVEGPGALEPTDEAAIQQRMDLTLDPKNRDAAPPESDGFGALSGEIPNESESEVPVTGFAPASAPEQTFAEPPVDTTPGRSGLEWALIVMSGFTGLLALSVVAFTWIPRRQF